MTSQADEQVSAFWEVAKRRAKLASLPGYFGPSALESLPPPAWSFGEDAEQADAFVESLLDSGAARSSVPRADYEAAAESLPEIGALGIVLDGSGMPQALVVTTEVHVDGEDVVEVMKVLYAAD
jgi:uncharacterized protein YhfF